LGNQNLIVAAFALLLLAGCSAFDGKHAICIDKISTEKYDDDWQNELRNARKAGKVSFGMAIDAQGKRYEKLGKLKYEKWTEFCDNLDAVRDEYGF
jgi:hypothetical protein